MRWLGGNRLRAGYAGIAAEGFTRPVACSANAACVAVGTYFSSSNGDRPLIEQLAGGTWTVVPVAFPPGYASGSDSSSTVRCGARTPGRGRIG